MRLNKYIAASTSLSRRAADDAIAEKRVRVNDALATPGLQVGHDDVVTLDGVVLKLNDSTTTIMLNKPVGYVCSREGQGSRTVYELLPPELQRLNSVGRLDKNSSGLLLLTDDGQFAHELTHPSRQKIKIYQVELYKPLQPLHRQMISDHGLHLADGPSRLQLERQVEADDTKWIVSMREGRNRQIRRTFDALGYSVKSLHRTDFGDFRLGELAEKAWEVVNRNIPPAT